MGHWCWEGISFPGWGRKAVYVQLYSFALAFLEVVSLFYKCIFWELPGKCLSRMEMEISELTGMKTFGSVLTEWKEDYQPSHSPVCKAVEQSLQRLSESYWLSQGMVLVNRIEWGCLRPSWLLCCKYRKQWNLELSRCLNKMGFFFQALWTGLEPVFLHYCKRINGFVTAFGPEKSREGMLIFPELLEGFRNEGGVLEQMQMAYFHWGLLNLPKCKLHLNRKMWDKACTSLPPNYCSSAAAVSYAYTSEKWQWQCLE